MEILECYASNTANIGNDCDDDYGVEDIIYYAPLSDFKKGSFNMDGIVAKGESADGVVFTTKPFEMKDATTYLRVAFVARTAKPTCTTEQKTNSTTFIHNVPFFVFEKSAEILSIINSLAKTNIIVIAIDKTKKDGNAIYKIYGRTQGLRPNLTLDVTNAENVGRHYLECVSDSEYPEPDIVNIVQVYDTATTPVYSPQLTRDFLNSLVEPNMQSQTQKILEVSVGTNILSAKNTKDLKPTLEEIQKIKEQ